MDGLTLPAGKSRRLLAVGDIHGCRQALRELLDRVAPTEHDQLVFLGDYIDRGPDSAGVVGDLLALREHLPGTVFLRGNHEQLLLEVLAGADPLNFLLNGGGETIASYRKAGGWPPPLVHQAFFASLLPLFSSAEFIFVHAGLRPGIPLAEQSSDDLLWIREDFLAAEGDWGKTVVFGHTPVEKPLLRPDRIGLDTGCVYGGRLTCCAVNTRQTWQASCAKL